MHPQSTVKHEMKPIYQCDPHIRQTLQSVKDHLHQLCGHHSQRLVRVETADGDVFEGHIVHCDKGIVYLRLSNEGCNRGFFPGPQNPYLGNLVLPLVLFNLLTISLL